jgi:hypothetical protein
MKVPHTSERHSRERNFNLARPTPSFIVYAVSESTISGPTSILGPALLVRPSEITR